MKKSVIISEEALQNYNEELHQSLADEINEYLSDICGFCHKGFQFEIVVKNIKWDKSE